MRVGLRKVFRFMVRDGFFEWFLVCKLGIVSGGLEVVFFLKYFASIWFLFLVNWVVGWGFRFGRLGLWEVFRKCSVFGVRVFGFAVLVVLFRFRWFVYLRSRGFFIFKWYLYRNSVYWTGCVLFEMMGIRFDT